jgi:hypothetical protein
MAKGSLDIVESDNVHACQPHFAAPHLVKVGSRFPSLGHLDRDGLCAGRCRPLVRSLLPWTH